MITVASGGEATARWGLLSASGAAAVPLLGVQVRAEVVAGHAQAVVRQRYRHDGPRPVEALYTFPLPSRAVLTAFTMTVAGRRIDGEVHEREEAFRRYDDAVTAGHGGALLEQERPNVFTANVGNLLPGEETILEIAYLEPVRSDEGAIRWSAPTLVAPRYMPGTPGGDRTGHGTADPTDRVPDADRISPPIGDVAYGLRLDLVFDVGQEVDVSCSSHAVTVAREGRRTRVTFAQSEVPLDRDVVVTAFPVTAAFEAAPMTSCVAHRGDDGPGTFAVTVVPDLAGALQARAGVRTSVVFVLDRSGSMGGSSIEEARTALKLCLRQLREGDTFAVLAFDGFVEALDEQMLPFTRATLERADAWIDGIEARGGTEMLAPLLRAAELAPDGVVVLLTDGEVGNEEQIEQAFMSRRGASRVYSFGIGTNVSDALLVALATRTGGAVETIHPGERIDEKVVAQFARATAPRVTELSIGFRGVDAGEIAPAEVPALIDGEPLSIFGTYEAAGRGAVEIRGTFGGERFFLEVPLDLPERAERPTVAKLWAQARIRDLERAVLSGRRAEAMKDRVVRLAKQHGISSRYTSFVVVEKRTGDRRASGQPETRVVPVSAPADWGTSVPRGRSRASRSAGIVASAALQAPAPPSAAPTLPPGAPTQAPAAPAAAPMFCAGAPPPPPPRAMSREQSTVWTTREDMGPPEDSAPPSHEPAEPIVALLARQEASGLWEEPGSAVLDATVRTLLTLVRAGVTADHPTHGAQVKKAVEALLALVTASPAAAPTTVELALGTAWLLSSGRRTRRAIEQAAERLGRSALAQALTSDAAARAFVDRLASHP